MPTDLQIGDMVVCTNGPHKEKGQEGIIVGKKYFGVTYEFVVLWWGYNKYIKKKQTMRFGYWPKDLSKITESAPVTSNNPAVTTQPTISTPELPKESKQLKPIVASHGVWHCPDCHSKGLIESLFYNNTHAYCKRPGCDFRYNYRFSR